MQNKRIGYIVIFSIIVIACLWAFISAGIITRNFKKEASQDDFSKKQVDIQNLLVTETKDGKKLWEMFAEKGHYDNKTNIVFLEDIIGNFYQNGEVVASYKSNQGTYNSEIKKVVLYNNSLIVYKDGSNFSASRIEWAGKNKDIVASGTIRLEKPKEAIIYGNKAVLSSDLSDFRVEGRTRTEIYSKGNLL